MTRRHTIRRLGIRGGCCGAVLSAGAAVAMGDGPPAPDDQGTTVPAAAVRHPDVAYASPGGTPLLLDLYTPPGPGPWPTVLWFHGGGWALGDRTGWPHLMFLLGHGYAVANVDYRLSQAAAFPAQLDDCTAALDYLAAHAAGYRLDPARMAAAGESAGGHLAALLGMTRGADVRGLPAGGGRVRAVLDLFGPSDLAPLADRSPKIADLVRRLLGGDPAGRAALARAASPVDRVGPGDPPFLIFHGDRDDVVPIDQSRRLVAALRAGGGSAEFVTVAGAGHAQAAFWAADYRRQMIAFLDRATAPRPAGR